MTTPVKVTIIVGILPWVMKLMYVLHRPDHADVIWLILAAPAMVICWPDLLFKFDNSSGGWFPLSLILWSSILNTLLATLIFTAIKVSRKIVAEQDGAVDS